jgi:hypothetical protein
MNFRLFLFLTTGLFANAQQLTAEQANKLAALPIKCLQQEYPNKLNQLLADATELRSPKELHPAFYGCFDWHSSVHGHWSLVYLINNFDELDNKNKIIDILKTNLSQTNIQKEIDYLNKKHENSFERTYGWAWILKLQFELETSKNQDFQALSKNLLPLSNLIIERYKTFLPKLLYAIRNGTHTNTAFGLTFAWDYAVFKNDIAFQKSIEKNANRLYKNDKNTQLSWEPSGTDFLSPSMEEIAIMQRILPKPDFLFWLKSFMPQILNKKFSWQIAKVSDRTDGHLVHLDGLNFSRAWNFYGLITQYPTQFSHLKALADNHFKYSLATITDGNYEGEHWLASFALYAFELKNSLKTK